MEPASSSSGRITSGPGLGIRTPSNSSQPLDIVPQVVVREIHITGPRLPVEARGSGHQPAVVFKEDATAGPLLTLNLDQSPAVPGDKESAKPPFHLIIVNVHDQNQSGELRVIWTTFIPPGQRVSHLLFFPQFYSPGCQCQGSLFCRELQTTYSLLLLKTKIRTEASCSTSLT